MRRFLCVLFLLGCRAPPRLPCDPARIVGSRISNQECQIRLARFVGIISYPIQHRLPGTLRRYPDDCT